jgi:hypothetical protein
MPRVGFETTTAAFKPAKTVHVLGRAATVIGQLIAFTLRKILIPEITLNHQDFSSVKLHAQCVASWEMF